MLQSKDIRWLIGLKNKTYLYAAYKRHTSKPKTHTAESEGWKKIFHTNGIKNKARAAILISDKGDFKQEQ